MLFACLLVQLLQHVRCHGSHLDYKPSTGSVALQVCFCSAKRIRISNRDKLWVLKA